MAIPGSGPLKISEIATEFGDTAPNSMSEYYRGGSLVPDAPANTSIPTSGAIGIGDFYGATNRVAVPLTISANTQNYNVYTQASASPLYTAGIADVTLTIQPGVVVGSSSTGTYALNVPNAFTAGDTVTIVNNGVVQGRAGNGGGGGSNPGVSGNGGSPGSAGGTGGNAVYVNFATTLTNNGTLAGGGGGGGGGGAGVKSFPNPKSPTIFQYGGGGGGGGGAGNTAGSGGGGGNPGGGTGGGGNSSSGGGGGAGRLINPTAGRGGNGGSGGGRGANGSGGGAATTTFRAGSGGGGGTRGFYVVGNPFITYPATGTREGQVS